jgi:hypothetical protein
MGQNTGFETGIVVQLAKKVAISASVSLKSIR